MHLAVGKKKKEKQVTLSMMSRLIEMQTLLRRYLRKTISLSSNQDSTICSYHKVVSVLRSCLFSSCSRVKNASFLMNMPIILESRMKKYFSKVL